MLYSRYSKLHIYFFWKAALFYFDFKEKGKARLGVVDFFFPHHPPSFSPNKSMHDFYFHPSLYFPLELSKFMIIFIDLETALCTSGDLTRFSKCTFWLFRMAYLCILFSHVIIYCINLLLLNVGYCTLIEYRLVLCSNFSLLWCEFCMFD